MTSRSEVLARKRSEEAERKAARKAAGLCTDCGTPAELGRTRCARHTYRRRSERAERSGAITGMTEASVERREAIVALLRDVDAPVSFAELADWLTLDARRRLIVDDLVVLARSGAIAMAGRGSGTRVAIRRELLGPQPDEEEVDDVPGLEVGVGDRRDDCASYSGCLSRFVRARHRWARLTTEQRKEIRAHADDTEDSADEAGDVEVPGRCPASCSHFTEVPRHVRRGLATVYSPGAHPLSGRF